MADDQRTQTQAGQQNQVGAPPQRPAGAHQVPNQNQTLKKKLPNLYRYVNPEPPEGYKLDYRFIERRDERQNIAVTKRVKDKIHETAARYKLSQNSFVCAVLSRFFEELDRIDKVNREGGQ